MSFIIRRLQFFVRWSRSNSDLPAPIENREALTRAELFEVVSAIVAERLDCDGLKNLQRYGDRADLTDHLGLDSLDLIEINSKLESKLDINIDISNFPELLTLGDYVDLVYSILKSASWEKAK